MNNIPICIADILYAFSYIFILATSFILMQYLDPENIFL